MVGVSPLLEPFEGQPREGSALRARERIRYEEELYRLERGTGRPPATDIGGVFATMLLVMFVEWSSNRIPDTLVVMLVAFGAPLLCTCGSTTRWMLQSLLPIALSVRAGECAQGISGGQEIFGLLVPLSAAWFFLNIPPFREMAQLEAFERLGIKPFEDIDQSRAFQDALNKGEPFAIYLRAFRAERPRLVGHGNSEEGFYITGVRFEMGAVEGVRKTLGQMCCFAVLNIREFVNCCPFPALILDRDSWESNVRWLMDRASLIIVNLSERTPGLRTEIAMILEDGLHEKCWLLRNPVTWRDRRDVKELSDKVRWLSELPKGSADEPFALKPPKDLQRFFDQLVPRRITTANYSQPGGASHAALRQGD